MIGVLGVQPHLDGMAAGLRHLARQAATPGDVELELHQVEPGGDLGDRVLHLQAGVDLDEVEGPGRRLEEELHGARALVLRGVADTERRLAQGKVLLRSEAGGRALLQDLLVLALDRAIPHPAGPEATVMVAQDLDLQVAHALEAALEEHRAVAEGLGGLGPRMDESLGQACAEGHAPDPRPPPPALALIISG